MGVEVEAILPTTNHLESLNGRLKNYYIPQWQHSGHRLRLDVLIFFLTSDILPRIYGQHRLLTNYSAWKLARFRAAAAGGPLSLAPSLTRTPLRGQSDSSGSVGGFVPRAWYTPDFKRDTDARVLYESGFLKPRQSGRHYELWASCTSSSGLRRLTSAPAQLPDDPSGFMVYSLTVHPSGTATCTCLDWLKRGGACKHLRAFRLLIEHWGAAGNLAATYIFPSTLEEAEKVDYQNRQWYGSSYSRAVTTSPLTANTGSLNSLPDGGVKIATEYVLPPRHLRLDNPDAAVHVVPSVEPHLPYHA